MAFDQRELATILAALRIFQRLDDSDRAMEPQFVADDIEPLTDPEIDELCERLNSEA